MPANPSSASSTSSPRLLEQVRARIRFKHYSIRTEQAYLDWIRRFIRHFDKKHPRDMGAKEVEEFLSHLAVAGRVSASTQNQAKSALLFLYKEVLGAELTWLDQVASAKTTKRLPVVLTPSEVTSMLSRLDGSHALLARLLYGTGLRIMEGLRLRVKDVDFERGEILVRDGKGGKDRVTMLPASISRALQLHLGACGNNIGRIWLRGTGKSICRLRWIASIRTRVENGAGSTYSHRPGYRSILARALLAAITCRINPCNAPSVRQSATRG